MMCLFVYSLIFGMSQQLGITIITLGMLLPATFQTNKVKQKMDANNDTKRLSRLTAILT